MIINKEFVEQRITTNEGEKVPYIWSHGATINHMGDGLLIYSLVQHLRAKTCVCIGSGGGYIPRILTQARIDLHNQKIFEGNPDYNWGDIGVTFVVDPCNGVGGNTNIGDENSYYRKTFHPRFINSTSENAYYNFFVLHDIKIDFLFIDGDHSYEGVKKDFELYSQIISENGVIVLHDSDENYMNNIIISEDEKKDFYPFDGPSKFKKEIDRNIWDVIDLFNFGTTPNKPTSTGITLINRKK